nr:reverse transcriptase domain-containing protein [Tanacetum cinerariifolium]
MKKAFKDMMYELGGKLIQIMHTTMVPEQVKTQKIQAGVQVSRLEDKDVIFNIGSALDAIIFLYICTCKEHLHQDKVHQEKLKAVKSRLNFEEVSQHSESGTLSRSRGLKKRLGSGQVCSMIGSLEPRRDRSKSPRKKDSERRTVFKRLEKGVFHRLGDKGKSMSAYSNGLTRWSYHSSREDTKSCYQSSRSRETEFASGKRHNKRASSQRMELLSGSEDSTGGHWNSKPKRKKSSIEDDLSQLWVCKETDHLTPWIRYFDFPKTRMPSHIKTYDESKDPEDYLKVFQAATKTERWAMPTWCHMYNSTLTRNARVWFDDLPHESIDSYDDLKKAFLENYLQQKKCIKDPVEIHNIKQRDGESKKEFVRRSHHRRVHAPKRQIKKMLKAKKLSNLIKELKQNNGKVQTKTVKKGETLGKDKPLAILMVQPWQRIAKQRITQNFSPKSMIFFPPLGEEDGTEDPMIIEVGMGGHFIHHRLKVCPDKVEVVLSLPSPKCLKDVQKINGKLESLNRPTTSAKRQILADFLMDRLEDDSPDTPIEDKEELSDSWILFIDRSSCIDGSRVGLIITNPEGIEFTYALRHDQILIEGQKPYHHFQRILHQTSTQRREQKSKRAKQDVIYQLRPPKQVEEILPEEKRKARAIRRKAGSPPHAKEPAVELDSHHIPVAILQMGIDIAGPFPKDPGKFKFFIVANDYFTKWIEATPMATIKGAQIKNFVWDNIVCRFGLPGEIISNNGKQFRDNPFKDWCEKLCIRQCFAFVKHPQVNGLVERANKSLGEGIKAQLDKRSKNWLEEILHIGMLTLRTAEVDMIKNDEALEINLDLLEEKREKAAIQEAKSKAIMEKYYNSKVRSTSFKPGDLVYRSNDASRTKEVEKLGPKWEGPYEIIEALGNGAYKLRDRDGKQLSRTWNVRNLKRCYVHEM